jgi:hypothetical protein
MSGTQSRSTKASGVRGWLRQVAVFTLILAASLFISSGHVDWVMAWIYVGVFVGEQDIAGRVGRVQGLCSARALSLAARNMVAVDSRRVFWIRGIRWERRSECRFCVCMASGSS